MRGIGVRKVLRWFRTPTLLDQIIQAEIDGLQVKEEDPEVEARLMAASSLPSRQSEEEVRQARLIRAFFTIGTEEEDPEDIALLTDEERERLEPIMIQRRWARFWASQR